MSLTAGTTLGPYEIQSPLGAGEMGEVYCARDTRLGRDVAIEVLQANAIQRQTGPFDVTGDGKKFRVNTGNLKEGSDPLTLVLNWTAELNNLVPLLDLSHDGP